jgi:hypothetical protein
MKKGSGEIERLLFAYVGMTGRPAVGLPPEGVGVLLVLDRLLGMARTSLTVFADAACSSRRHFGAQNGGTTAILHAALRSET